MNINGDEDPRERIREFYRSRLPEFLNEVREDSSINRHLSRYSPFVPYVGKNFRFAKPRIVIVGKATNEWMSTLDEAVSDAAKNVNELLEKADWVTRDTGPEEKRGPMPHYQGYSGYSSLFWCYSYRIASALLEGRNTLNSSKDPRLAERCFTSIAWSNVFKVGMDCSRNGTPDPPMIKFLLKHARRNWLSTELRLLNPDLVLFSTGWRYDNYLKQMLDIKGCAKLPDDIVQFELADSSCVALRSCHFQYWKFSPESLLKAAIERLPRH